MKLSMDMDMIMDKDKGPVWVLGHGNGVPFLGVFHMWHRMNPDKCLQRRKYKKSIFCTLPSKIPFMAHLPHEALKSTLVKHRSILCFPHIRLGEENVASDHVDSDEPERLKDKTKIIALEEREHGSSL